MSFAALVAQILSDPRGPAEIIADDEAAKGFNVVRPGDAPWFAANEWKPASVASIDDAGRVRLVLIDAIRPGTGALRRALAEIRALELKPMIIEPTRELAATLTRNGWKHATYGGGMEAETRWWPRQRATL